MTCIGLLCVVKLVYHKINAKASHRIAVTQVIRSAFLDHCDFNERVEGIKNRLQPLSWIFMRSLNVIQPGSIFGISTVDGVTKCLLDLCSHRSALS
jgi:hypothetical protein